MSAAQQAFRLEDRSLDIESGERDDPLAGLDSATRDAMREEARQKLSELDSPLTGLDPIEKQALIASQQQMLYAIAEDEQRQYVRARIEDRISGVATKPSMTSTGKGKGRGKNTAAAPMTQAVDSLDTPSSVDTTSTGNAQGKTSLHTPQQTSPNSSRGFSRPQTYRQQTTPRQPRPIGRPRLPQSGGFLSRTPSQHIAGPRRTAISPRTRGASARGRGRGRGLLVAQPPLTLTDTGEESADKERRRQAGLTPVSAAAEAAEQRAAMLQASAHRASIAAMPQVVVRQYPTSSRLEGSRAAPDQEMIITASYASPLISASVATDLGEHNSLDCALKIKDM